jgi:Transglycosylase SLT domain
MDQTVYDAISRACYATGVPLKIALAIVQQESGGDPNAIGDNGHSVGLFQLNDQGEGAGMTVAQRQDPYQNALIALRVVANVMQQHPDWSPGQIAAAAQRPANPSAYAQSVDAIYNGNGGGTVTASTTTPTGSASPQQSYQVPLGAGAQHVTIGGGYDMVLYQVAPGVYIYFGLSGVDASNLGPAVDLSSDQFNALHAISGGNGQALDSVRTTYGDFETFWNHILDTYLGPNQAARSDPGVLAVMAEIAGRPDMSAEEIQNKIKETTYWQTRTAGQLAWNDLSPAEQQKQIGDIAAQLSDQFFNLVGVTPGSDMTDAINYWALQVASGVKGMNEAVDTFIKGEALKNPESPWSRTIRTEQENERQRGVDISNQTETNRQLADKWGVQLAPDTLAQWGSDIVTKTKSAADYVDYLRGQAQILYPWIKQLDPTGETDTQTLATPWTQTYARVMEKPGELSNPQIQQALSNATPVWQFEQDLKRTPDWLTTKNAQQDMTSAAGDLGRRMGFN